MMSKSVGCSGRNASRQAPRPSPRGPCRRVCRRGHARRASRRRGHDHDHGGPGRQQQSRRHVVVAADLLEVEGQRHHSEHLPQKRGRSTWRPTPRRSGCAAGRTAGSGRGSRSWLRMKKNPTTMSAATPSDSSRGSSPWENPLDRGHQQSNVRAFITARRASRSGVRAPARDSRAGTAG